MPGLEHLEQACSAHAAAHAHRDDNAPGPAALALEQRMASEPCAGHPERVSDRDGAAVDVVLGRIDAQLVPREQALAVVEHGARGTERIATLRREMAQTMEEGCGIYRTGATMQATCDKLAELKQRYRKVHLDDGSRVWNTEWLLAIELGYLLDVAQAMAHSALQRRESRGSHQRLDGYEQRDDLNFLQHSLATHAGDDAPRISYGPVKITRSPPGTRAYGAAGEKAEAERHAQEDKHV